ncbi:hypothetical protein DPMN_087954 [Dreissena polymorpha]|uniref:Uncharacterized protein n=1 Tax=Dreissena polymorpha TaxID=45954 RepID=A0A9D4KU64_DREPO|nr:hypothetical protein DPMN_087954 [Dreissena polymorpha]
MATKPGQTKLTWSDIRSWEQVFDIKDLGTLVGIVRELRLDTKGLKTLDDFHKLILDHWKRSRGDFVLKGDEVS